MKKGPGIVTDRQAKPGLSKPDPSQDKLVSRGDGVKGNRDEKTRLADISSVTAPERIQELGGQLSASPKISIEQLPSESKGKIPRRDDNPPLGTAEDDEAGGPDIPERIPPAALRGQLARLGLSAQELERSGLGELLAGRRIMTRKGVLDWLERSSAPREEGETLFSAEDDGSPTKPLTFNQLKARLRQLAREKGKPGDFE